MKFKYLIIAFSIIVIIIILVTVFLSVLLTVPVTGFESELLQLSGPMLFTVNFRLIILPFLLIMILLLACMSIFFFLNYRLLSLLEREDWPALAYYLEQKIYVKGRYNLRYIRLLASSYLVISDYLSVLKLESKAQLVKPSLITKNVLIFGAARVLNSNPAEAVVFFKTHMEKCNPKDKQWVQWFYGFSLLLAGAFDEVEPVFSLLSVSSSDALITGLSAYFLTSSLEKRSKTPEKCTQLAENGKKRVVKTIKNLSGWKKEIEKFGSDIHIAIVKKYIDETGTWLFG